MPPLVITLAFDDAAQARLDALRRAHFPPERNFLSAHLTLFHALPGEEEPVVAETLRAHADATAPMRLTIAEPISLGRGVALRVAGAALDAFHASLVRAFAPWLSAQDRQGFRPHVTIQNKVAPAQALELLAELSASWRQLPATGVGLDLWQYRGGPWEHRARVPFAAAA